MPDTAAGPQLFSTIFAVGTLIALTRGVSPLDVALMAGGWYYVARHLTIL